MADRCALGAADFVRARRSRSGPGPDQAAGLRLRRQPAANGHRLAGAEIHRDRLRQPGRGLRPVADVLLSQLAGACRASAACRIRRRNSERRAPPFGSLSRRWSRCSCRTAHRRSRGIRGVTLQAMAPSAASQIGAGSARLLTRTNKISRTAVSAIAQIPGVDKTFLDSIEQAVGKTL